MQAYIHCIFALYSHQQQHAYMLIVASICNAVNAQDEAEKTI